MSAETTIRWIARIWSIASALVLIPFAFSGGGLPNAYEWTMLLFFPVGVLIGFLIAWRREGLGGTISVLSLIVFAALLYFRDGRLLGPYFLLFSAPGFLFLFCRLFSRKAPQVHVNGA